MPNSLFAMVGGTWVLNKALGLCGAFVWVMGCGSGVIGCSNRVMGNVMRFLHTFS